MHTLNIISDLHTVKYSKDPMIPTSLSMSILPPCSSLSIRKFDGMGVEMLLESIITYIFMSFNQYFVWLMNMLASVCFIYNPKK